MTEVTEEEISAEQNTQEKEKEIEKNEGAATRKFAFDKDAVVRYLKKLAVLAVGLFIMAFGVAFSINATLGTSPVSSIPYVTSIISGLSVGVMTMIVNTVIVLLQIPVLRKKFNPVRLLQIPVSIVFGLLIDLASLCIKNVVPVNYLIQWLLCIAGIILVAIGVSFEMAANVLTLPGEGFVSAVCTVAPIKFGYMKVIMDVSLVVIAVAFSFGFTGKLQGVREGTLAASVFVGLIAKLLAKAVNPLVNRLTGGKRAEDKEVRAR